MNRQSPVTLSSLSFRTAERDDVPAVTQLVNSAYRGNTSTTGWTTEASLLEGRRTDENGVLSLIEERDSLLLLCLHGSDIIGSVHLQKTNETEAYLGMFVVKPGLQGVGIGEHFMQAAESTASERWNVTRISMTVITLRHELIAYYERRGYRRTGQHIPFPFEDGMSKPLVEGIRLEVMEKLL